MMKRLLSLSLLALAVCAVATTALADESGIVRSSRTGPAPMDHPGVVRGQDHPGIVRGQGGGMTLQEVEIAVRR